MQMVGVNECRGGTIEKSFPFTCTCMENVHAELFVEKVVRYAGISNTLEHVILYVRNMIT